MSQAVPPPRLQVRTVPIDEDRALLDLIPDLPVGDRAVAWVRRGAGLVGWGQAVRIEPTPGPGRFRDAEVTLRRLRAEVDDRVGLPGTGLVGIGSFAFTDRDPGSALIVPRRVVGRRQGTTWLTTIDPPGEESDAPAPPGPRPSSPPPGAARDRPRYAGSSKPDRYWLEAVAEAIGRIGAGELAKVVLARDHAVWAHEPFDALDLARRLTDRFPRCHTFVVDGLVGATPELLLARVGDRVRSRVLAGTVARSDDADEDAALGASLLASAKDRHEHRLAAESVREVLAPRCTELRHEQEPRLLALDNVQHLATLFEGRLTTGDGRTGADGEAGAHGDGRTGADGEAGAPPTALELVAALHPTAAVGGTPRSTALALIDELEGMQRGRYAAPVGWTDQSGDGEWGIALRCAELSGARARLFAGVGIVGASLPEAELEETRLKLLAMQEALGERSPGAGVR